jgi:hypothetical protein
MRRSGAARAGIWLSIYAWGGTLVGIVGFGMLWRGASALRWPEAAGGLGLLVLGLDRAGTAFALSMRSRRAVERCREAGGRDEQPRPPVP